MANSLIYPTNSLISSNLSASNQPVMVNQCSNIKEVIRILNTAIPLFWLCVGTCTNILSLIIFSRANLRINSTFFYLTLMTASDLIVIWLSSFRDFLVYKYQVYVTGTLACKLHVFSFFLLAQFSSWMLAAASFDRLVLVVSYNSFSKIWCTKSMAKRFSICLLAIFCALNFHFLVNVKGIDNILAPTNTSLLATSTKIMPQQYANISFNIPNSENIETNSLGPTLIHPIVYSHCEAKPGYYSEFYTKYYTWIDSIMYSFLPFLIMCVCNYTLIRKVFNSKKNLYKNSFQKERNQSGYHSVSQNEQELSPLPATPTISLNIAIFKTSNMTGEISEGGGFGPTLSILDKFSNRETRLSMVSLDPNNNNNISNQSSSNMQINSTPNTNNLQIPLPTMDKMRNMALTIIGVTMLFILFTVPINIYIPIMHLQQQDENPISNCDDLIFCLLNNMVNANHATSFFIYLSTNSKFKNEIQLMWSSLCDRFGFKRRHKSPRSQANTRGLSFSRVTTNADR